MTLLIEAIGKAGLNRTRIRDELTALKSYDGITDNILFDETHNDIGPVWLSEVRNGEFQFFPSTLAEQ